MDHDYAVDVTHLLFPRNADSQRYATPLEPLDQAYNNENLGHVAIIEPSSNTRPYNSGCVYLFDRVRGDRHACSHFCRVSSLGI